MIGYITGEYTESDDNFIIVEAYGVGYEIMVPASIIPRLPVYGSRVKIYTYQNVREDALDLYGFLTKDDLYIFKLLITVNGIGPKGALSILSYISPDELRMAVISDDVKRIQSAPGIGIKTAQKLIIELKDRIKSEDIIYHRDNVTDGNMSMTVRDEAVEALSALGYTPSEAMKAVRDVAVTDDMGSEDILKQALKRLAFM